MLANFPVDTVNQHRKEVVGGIKPIEAAGDEVISLLLQ